MGETFSMEHPLRGGGGHPLKGRKQTSQTWLQIRDYWYEFAAMHAATQ